MAFNNESRHATNTIRTIVNVDQLYINSTFLNFFFEISKSRPETRTRRLFFEPLPLERHETIRDDIEIYGFSESDEDEFSLLLESQEMIRDFDIYETWPNLATKRLESTRVYQNQFPFATSQSAGF